MLLFPWELQRIQNFLIMCHADMTLVNVFLTCHVSLCLSEPTGNLQIMEAQFHNSLNPSRANTTATPHALFTTFSEKKILNIYIFFIRAMQQHPSIWGLFPKRSGKFKRLRSWILEFYWSVSKNTWESFILRKLCDWTIFLQVSRFECPHCNVLV